MSMDKSYRPYEGPNLPDQHRQKFGMFDLKLGAATQYQCPKLRFYFMRPQGALVLKLCAREFFHASY